MRAVLLVQLIALTAPALGGCVGDDDGPFVVPHAGPGSWALYGVENLLALNTARPTYNETYAVEPNTRVLRGDGAVVDALAMARARQDGDDFRERLFVDAGSRDAIRHQWGDGGYAELGLNERQWPLAPELWGRSLSKGDTWTAPYHSPRSTHLIQWEVLDASPDGAVVRKVHARIGTVIAEDGDGLAWQVTLARNRPFPVEVRAYDVSRSGMETLGTRWVFLDGERVARKASSVETVDLPADLALQAWTIFPPMEASFLRRPFSEFTAFAAAHEPLVSYLGSHPDARATSISYDATDEEEGFRVTWNALFRDASAEAYVLEVVVRCFSNAAHQALYGECRTDVSSSASRQVPPAEGWQEPQEVVPLEIAAKTLIAFGGDDVAIVHLAWKDHPVALFSGDELTYHSGDAGWMLGTGSRTDRVNYLDPVRGPYSMGGGTSDVYIGTILDGTGWVLTLTTDFDVSP